MAPLPDRVRPAQRPGPLLTWVATDLSEEFSPSFKLLVDPDMDELGESQAQIFLSTVTRNVRLSDGKRRTIRIPDTILRVRSSEDESLLQALGRIANQWDFFLQVAGRPLAASERGGPSDGAASAVLPFNVA